MFIHVLWIAIKTMGGITNPNIKWVFVSTWNILAWYQICPSWKCLTYSVTWYIKKNPNIWHYKIYIVGFLLNTVWYFNFWILFLNFMLVKCYSKLLTIIEFSISVSIWRFTFDLFNLFVSNLICNIWPYWNLHCKSASVRSCFRQNNFPNIFNALSSI